MNLRKNLIISLIIVGSFLAIFVMPAAIVGLISYISENFFSIDCSSHSGGSFPFPTTTCGNILAISGLYYIWFIIPVPLVIPILATIKLTKHLIKKYNIRLK